MSRTPIKLLRPSYLTEGDFTEQFHIFFGQSRMFNASDVVVGQGFIALSDKTPHALRDNDEIEADRYITEILYSAIVDNFQCFLTDLLLCIFDNKPEILSGGSTKNAIIFGQNDLSSLKRYIVEKNVLDLGYKRIDELDKYFLETFKFSLTDSKLENLRLNRIIQIRNVIAHNRGKVSNQFIMKAGSKADKVGQKVLLPNLYATDCYLIALAERIDRKAIEKFGLPSFEFKPE